MRKPVTLVMVAINCLIALLAFDRIALGQAGSTGGTIGKTDKSVSGGEEQTPERKTAPEARRPERSSDEGICSKTLHPNRCRCALRAGGYIRPEPTSPTGLFIVFPSRAVMFECRRRYER